MFALEMSEEQLKAFLEAVKADAGLQEKLNAAADAEAVVEIAKEAGFGISADELQRAQAEVLRDAELEGVTGGRLEGRKQMAVVTLLSGIGCLFVLAGRAGTDLNIAN